LNGAVLKSQIIFIQQQNNKLTESEVNEMCNISDGVFEKGVNQGFFSGSSNEKYETVMRMLEDNADDTLIIKYAGVTAEILEEIKKKLSRNQK